MDQADYLIVGQGLVGSILAYKLSQQNKRVVIIDKGSGNTASRQASGLINPITGRRFVKTWMIEELLPEARSFYKELSIRFNHSLYKETSLLKILHTNEQVNDFHIRRASEAYAKYLFEYPDETPAPIQGGFGQAKIKSLTHSEMAKLLELHPGIIESASATVKIFPKIATNIAAGHYIINYLGYPKSRADDLISVWKSGQQTYENDAMVFVREYFIKHQANDLRISMDFRRRLFNTGFEKFIQMKPMQSSRLGTNCLKINGWTEQELGLVH